MSEIDLFESKTESRRLAANIRLLAGVVVLGIAIAVGVIFVFRFADAQYDRDLREWQVRLGIVAESRLQAVNGWLETQYDGLQGLADNTALKLYMTELTLAEGDIDEVTDEPAQRTYLRNLLVATADRTGFIGPVLGPEVNTNVERVGLAGLALADANGQILVATPEFPPGDAKLRALLRETPMGERGMRDIYAGAAGDPSIAFIAPIFMLQREGDPAAQIGHVIGIKLVEEELYGRLKQPGTTEESAEALLVRQTPSTVEYLSPQADGTLPLKRSLALDTEDLAAAFAIAKPGGFGLKKDYRGSPEVLVTSRAGAVDAVVQSGPRRSDGGIRFTARRHHHHLHSGNRRGRHRAPRGLVYGLFGARHRYGVQSEGSGAAFRCAAEISPSCHRQPAQRDRHNRRKFDLPVRQQEGGGPGRY